MTELTENEQEIVKQGQLAEAALASPAIASAINELSEYLANKIISTSLSEKDKREEYYFLHVALRELVAILNHRVGLKQNIEAQMADEETN